MSLAQRVADRWEEDGVAWDAGADAELLDEAERVHGVQLPPSFRELWRLRDGTTAPDRHWLIFMQASDLAQPLYATRGPEGVALIFADWRQGTALALRLGPEDRGVVRIEDAPRLLAASFDAFLETYLREAPDDFTQLLRRSDAAAGMDGAS
ncbi:MAG: SMI1/KNR4 family protein [Sandaracinaceae bacterium]|nr:SMI1/KNR4 family protein [Sandaracinaceae bacterium]